MLLLNFCFGVAIALSSVVVDELFVSPSGNDSADGLSWTTAVRSSRANATVNFLTFTNSTRKRLRFAHGVFTSDCDWVTPLLYTLDVIGNGTVFACAEMNSSVQMSLSAMTVSVQGLSFRDLRGSCAVLPCAALVVRGMLSADVQDLRVSNVTLTVPATLTQAGQWPPSPNRNVVAPVVVDATLVSFSGVHLADNSVTSAFVSNANETTLSILASGGCVAHCNKLNLSASIFSANRLESSDVSGAIGGAGFMWLLMQTTNFDDHAGAIAASSFLRNSVVGSADIVGGAILAVADTLVVSAALSVTDSIFADGQMTSNASQPSFAGGAIGSILKFNTLLSPLDLVVDNCTFRAHVVNGAASRLYGGVVRAFGVRITNTTFADHAFVSSIVVGGLIAAQGIVAVDQCTFANNSFDALPYSRKGTSLNGVLFFADDDARSSCENSVAFSWSNTTVQGNTVWSSDKPNGDSLLRVRFNTCVKDVVSIVDSHWVDNVALPEGCVRVSGGCVSIERTSFRDNHGAIGVGFNVDRLESFDLVDCEFVGNRAVSVGACGAVYSSRYVNVYSSLFVDNSAAAKAACLYFESVDQILLNGVTLQSGQVQFQGDLSTALAFVSLTQFSLSLRNVSSAGGDIVVDGPLTKLDVGNSDLSAAALTLRCDISVLRSVSLLLTKSNFSSVHVTAQGSLFNMGLTVVAIDVKDSIIHVPDLPAGGAAFQVDGWQALARFSNTVFRASGSNRTSTRPFSGTLSIFSLRDCQLFGTLPVQVAAYSVVVSNTTFLDSFGALENIPGVSCYSWVVSFAFQSGRFVDGDRKVHVLDVQDCAQVLVHRVDVQQSNVSGDAISIRSVRSTTIRDVRVVLSESRASSIVALSNTSTVSVSNLTIDRCRFTSGAVTLAQIADPRTWINVSLTNNVAAVSAGALNLLDDPSQLPLFPVTTANNSAGCFRDDTSTAPVSFSVLVNDGDDGIVRVRPGESANFSVVLSDLFGRLPPSCAAFGRVRTTPIAVFATVNGSLFHFCDIAFTDNACRGLLPFEGALGTTENVTMTVTFANVTLERLATLLIDTCGSGFALIGDKCVRCQPQTYSLARNASVCHFCPPDATCIGGDALQSSNGTWLSAVGDDVQVYRCLPGACRGGRVLGSVVENRCAPNRTGLLCASCGPMQSPVAPRGDVACVACPESNALMIALFVASAFALALLLHASNSSSASSTKIKLLSYYGQVAPIVLPSDFGKDVVFRAFNFEVASATASFGTVCVALVDHFDLLLWRLMLPLATIAALAVIFAVAKLVRRLRTQRVGADDERDDSDDGGVATANNSELSLPFSDLSEDDVPLVGGVTKAPAGASTAHAPADDHFFAPARFWRTIVALVFLTFSVTLAGTLDVLDCTTIGDAVVLRSDVRASCSDDRHKTWANVAFYVLLPYLAIVVIGTPTALFWLRRRNNGALPRSVALGYMYELYRPDVAMYWECVVLLRRLALGVVNVAMPNNTGGVGTRFFVLNTINVLALVSTLQLHPLQSELEHRLDVLQLAMLVVVGNNLASLEQHPVDDWGRPVSREINNGVVLSLLVAVPIVCIGLAVAHGSALKALRMVKRLRARQH